MVVWGATFFVVVCVSLYLMMESVSTNMGKSQELDAVSRSRDCLIVEPPPAPNILHDLYVDVGHLVP